MAKMTPLRYPGGKARLYKYFKRLIEQNRLHDCEYTEPFCGGAGLAIELLRSGVVSAIHLNDLDPAVFAFWHCAVERTEELCALIKARPVTMDTWHACRDVYRAPEVLDEVELGFSAFFLNRTNRSGILEAGVIGGYDQSGKWKMDARYNVEGLVERIRIIGNLRPRIRVTNLDALRLVRTAGTGSKLFYLDPPYVEKGPRLYLNAYDESDHVALARAVSKMSCPWVVSYDDNALVRTLYQDYASDDLRLQHTARAHDRVGEEVVFFSPGLSLPNMEGIRSKYRMPWVA